MTSKVTFISGPLVDVAAIQRQLKQALRKSKSYDLKKTASDASSSIVLASVPHTSSVEDVQSSFSPDYLFFSTQREFHTSDFLYVSEQFFIESLFIGILRRNIEESAKDYWLKYDYRSRVQRINIINKISASPEGKSRRVKIRGLRRYTVLTKVLTLKPLIFIRNFLVRKVGL